MLSRNLVFALAASLGAGAAAREPVRADPADSRAPVAPVEFRTGLETYRPYVEPELLRWSEANELVRRLGGHRGHVQRVQPAGEAAPGSDLRSTAPVAAGERK
jgi:hypothetical protein